MKRKIEERICPQCKKKFYVRPSETKRFCGNSCSMKWRMNQPGYAKAIALKTKIKMPFERKSKIMKKIHKEKPWIAEQASIRMKKNNPMMNPKTVEKMKQHFKKYGHPLKGQQLKGGNGRPIPYAQRTLWAALADGWILEYPIKTKVVRNLGYPTCYKADIANPELKIWIEVDGWGHQLPDGKKRDKKKEDFLKTLGWKGLRFWNQEIEDDIKMVLAKVQQFIISK